MQGLHSQLTSIKGHVKDAVNAREACEQEIQRLKGDLTTMTQENQVVNISTWLYRNYSYITRLFMKSCVMPLKKEKH